MLSWIYGIELSELRAQALSDFDLLCWIQDTVYNKFDTSSLTTSICVRRPCSLLEMLLGLHKGDQTIENDSTALGDHEWGWNLLWLSQSTVDEVYLWRSGRGLIECDGGDCSFQFRPLILQDCTCLSRIIPLCLSNLRKWRNFRCQTSVHSLFSIKIYEVDEITDVHGRCGAGFKMSLNQNVKASVWGHACESWIEATTKYIGSHWRNIAVKYQGHLSFFKSLSWSTRAWQEAKHCCEALVAWKVELPGCF